MSIQNICSPVNHNYYRKLETTLKLLEILNEAQRNFILTKEDLDIMIQFGRFNIIIAELKQINCSQGKHVSNVGKTKSVH